MLCKLIQPELVAFYFGDVDEAARARVEAHLRECRACLDVYLSLKRSIEAADLKPSDEARVRLRAAVARELSAGGSAPALRGGASATEPAPWLWWERPLAVAFATAAVALVTVTVSQL